MSRIPNSAPSFYNSTHVNIFKQIHPYYADSKTVTKISELISPRINAHTDPEDRKSPLLYRVIPKSTSDYYQSQFDSLVHDIPESAEVHTLLTEHAFTLAPNSVFTIFGTCTSSKAAFFKTISASAVPLHAYKDPRVDLHFDTVPLHTISQICFRNDTPLFVNCKLMKTVSIDRYHKPTKR
jgi:hypothetical protein